MIGKRLDLFRNISNPYLIGSTLLGLFILLFFLFISTKVDFFPLNKYNLSMIIIVPFIIILPSIGYFFIEKRIKNSFFRWNEIFSEDLIYKDLIYRLKNIRYLILILTPAIIFLLLSKTFIMEIPLGFILQSEHCGV